MKPIPLALLALVPLAYQATQEEPAPPGKVAVHLMFEGKAEEALELYVSLLPGSKVESIERFGPGEAMGKEGSVKLATVSLAGTRCLFFDSSFDHPFTFTPSMSLFVTCESEAELDQLFAELSKEGQVLMPPANYDFSRKFTWVEDRFGVSWQLNWP
jgi:predicted 3-demethylubiquinone-9 3-methyltransferase (glyoxalase superfamily)